MTILASTMAKQVRRRAWPPLLHQVVKTIRSNGLVDRGQHLLVAVSGGPDSVALLSLLHRLRSSWSLTVTAVHFNYGLRGAESEGDQEFVTAFCRELNIPLYTRRFEIRGREHRTSLQAAARDLRYRAMLDTAEECGADRIALGHSANDQAETVLLWILRGAGLTGLSGMPAFRDGKIIRPLLDITREDILAYLNHEGLSFRQDSSNSKPIYLRNRIRQEVMPCLTRLVPSSVRTLCRLADVCREDDSFLDQQVAALCASRIRQDRSGGWTIDRSFLQQLTRAAQRRVVRDLLRRCDSLHRSPSIHTVERFLQAVKRKRSVSVLTMKSARMLVESDLVRFIPFGPPELSHTQLNQVDPTTLLIPGAISWAGTGWRIRVQQVTRSQVPAPAQGRTCIVVDADRVSEPLVVRSWQSGDRFHPFGMKGRSKKLQDFFTDLKLSTAARGQIPVVAAPEGIVWIVGYRQDERWALTAATKRYLLLTAHEESARKGI